MRVEMLGGPLDGEVLHLPHGDRVYVHRPRVVSSVEMRTEALPQTSERHALYEIQVRPGRTRTRRVAVYIGDVEK